MNSLILSIGSNQGDKSKYLEKSLEEIEKRIGKITKKSFIYETEPVGFESNDSFLNACLEVKTNLNLTEIIAITQEIEKENGRMTKSISEYKSRTLDIDIIFFNSLSINTETLQIPHPRYTERLFVLIPLCDIISQFQDPVNGLTIEQLNVLCSDSSRLPKRIKQL